MGPWQLLPLAAPLAFLRMGRYGSGMTQYQVVAEGETVLRDGTIKLHGPAAFEAMRRAGRLAAQTLDALAPFRCKPQRPSSDPQPLPYLDSTANRSGGAYDIELEVWLQTTEMQKDGLAPQLLSQSNFRDAYWTLSQLVTHHTVNGCNLRAGDVLGTGTLSGPQAMQGGSLLELSQGGQSEIMLDNGELRTFLQDGDTVILKAYAERAGARRIGFGECRGTLLAARTP